MSGWITAVGEWWMHHNPTVTLQTGMEEIDPNVLNNNEIKHLLYKEIIL